MGPDLLAAIDDHFRQAGFQCSIVVPNIAMYVRHPKSTHHVKLELSKTILVVTNYACQRDRAPARVVIDLLHDEDFCETIAGVAEGCRCGR